MPSAISHVSDTAFWVAHYRGVESARPDALFRDPYAFRLAGEEGRSIAKAMGAPFTAWLMAIRTRMIDDYIEELASQVDLVLNLGAGLDSRPYRLRLPERLRWIEVDHAHVIELKEARLARERPRCVLERVKLDLEDDAARRDLLRRIGSSSENALVLTEGVVPYLTVSQVGELADDLHAQASFRHWIVEYYSPGAVRFLKRSRRHARRMKNAPFRFFPDDWFELFAAHGFRAREIRYLPETSVRLGRRVPKPGWLGLMFAVLPKRHREGFARSMGYALLEPAR
jgi:methyltransferase (TIGR00027 family)